MSDEVFGCGDFRYRRKPSWPTLPKYWGAWTPSDAAVNAKGEIYVVARDTHFPVSVWTPEGEFLGGWGRDHFSSFPHGIDIAPNNNVWIVDRSFHIATEFTPEGQPLRVLGQKLSPSPTCDGRLVRARPFNMPTNLAIAPNGDIFVADGYGGHKVHRFAADGSLKLSWGRQGNGPGEFALVHNVWVDSRERVLICDDENDRLQIFDQNGIFLEEWKFGNPSGLCVHNDIVYVTELQPFPSTTERGGTGALSILSLEGKLLSRWLGSDGGGNPCMQGPHDLCVDARGDLYVCEVRGRQISKFVRLN